MYVSYLTYSVNNGKKITFPGSIAEGETQQDCLKTSMEVLSNFNLDIITIHQLHIEKMIKLNIHKKNDA